MYSCNNMYNSSYRRHKSICITQTDLHHTNYNCFHESTCTELANQLVKDTNTPQPNLYHPKGFFSVALYKTQIMNFMI